MFIDNAKKYIKTTPLLRDLLNLYLRQKYFPQWDKLLGKDWAKWEEILAHSSSKNKKKVLLATAVGRQFHTITVESLLSVALTLRDAEVHVLLCDKVLPACFTCSFAQCRNRKVSLQNGPAGEICDSCFPPAHKMYSKLGIQTHLFSDFLSEQNQSDIEAVAQHLSYKDMVNYKINDCSIGEHALAGALRFYARATLEHDKDSEIFFRHYFKASLMVNTILNNMLGKQHYDCAVFTHGIYVPHGIIGDACRHHNVRVVNWIPSYRKKTFIFTHGETYHHALMKEPVNNWENVILDKSKDEELSQYLKSRWGGKEDWIWFSANTCVYDKEKIEKTLGIDFGKPCIGMLTNVMWDAQLHYPANAFDNMLDWIIKTIDYFSKRPDLQLLIRVHPAEITSAMPSRQKVTEEIKNKFPSLPKNIFIIPPESPINTYVAMSECDSVIIYGTKTGVELTALGIPVIVAGEAWIRNKGLTTDVSSPDEYFKVLDCLPAKKRLDKTTIEKARRYAFHFFFRRMIPLEFIQLKKTDKRNFDLDVSSLNQIMPFKSKGLDVICNGILNGSDFIYKKEED